MDLVILGQLGLFSLFEYDFFLDYFKKKIIFISFLHKYKIKGQKLANFKILYFILFEIKLRQKIIPLVLIKYTLSVNILIGLNPMHNNITIIIL